MTEIFVDGSGFNGVNSAYCVLIGERKIVKVAEKNYTNNETEYLAMIEGLKLATDGNTIYSDSQLVVNQLTQGWAVKQSTLMPFHKEAKDLLASKPKVKIKWVAREFNRAGHILEDRLEKIRRYKNESTSTHQRPQRMQHRVRMNCPHCGRTLEVDYKWH